MHSIAVQHIKREDTQSSSGSKTARVSVDFLIDGASLLTQLLKADGGHGDFMGCFVHGFPVENANKKSVLLLHSQQTQKRGGICSTYVPSVATSVAEHME
jgi:hypothetical protein